MFRMLWFVVDALVYEGVGGSGEEHGQISCE